MRCFDHPTTDSIGMCKVCNKGLCADCAADLGHGLACKDKHESEVELIHRIIAQSARVSSVIPISRYVSPLFAALMGLLFLGYGYSSGGRALGLLAWMGVAFLVYAVVVVIFNLWANGKR